MGQRLGSKDPFSEDRHLLGDGDSAYTHSLDSGLSQDKESDFSEDPGSRTSFMDLTEQDEHLEPITLSWDNINVLAPPEKLSFWKKRKGVEPNEPKHILQNASGVVTPGSLLAIIGASGSGKTVLLNVLTRRNLGKLMVKGDVRVNGKYIGQDISKICAYSQQQDVFIGTLKVREHLWFQAQLRLDKNMSDEERERRVEDVMTEMGLKKRENTLIGIPGKVKTLSGGERKRLSFASEILTNPAVLFCDEPTTGLDSFMAESVVQTLKNMAARGRTILCTIHQPASEVYTLFDQLLLLADGRMAYMGPTIDVLPFFSSIGYPCPPNYNPADFFIHTLALVPGKEDEHYQTVKKICDSYEKSVFKEDIKEAYLQSIEEREMLDTEASLQKAYSGDTSQDQGEPSRYKASWNTQFRTLLWRCWLSLARDPIVVRATLIQNIVVGIALGLLYLQQSIDQKGVQNIDGALYMMQIQAAFAVMFSVLCIFPSEYELFRRESQNAMYRTEVYYISHLITQVPLVTGIPIVFTSITYWMIGLYPAFTTFMVAVVDMMVLCLYAAAIGHLVSTATCSIGLTLAVLPAVRNTLTIFGGFFINAKSVPKLLLPIQYLACTYYSNEIMIVNQWENVDYISCDSNNSTESSTRCLQNGQDVIATFSFNEAAVPYDFAILVTLYILLEVGGFLCLYSRARKFRS